MNKDNLTKRINYSSSNFQTHIICPYCKKNFLEFNKNNTNKIFTSRCVSPDSDPRDDKFFISGILICKYCEKGITFLGKGNNDLFEIFDKGESYDEYGESLEFLAFAPPLELIGLSDKIPPKIQESLRESFSLYFLFNEESVLAGYEMLEKALDLIYVKDNQKLLKIRDKILKTKRYS
jgi:uncharacterized protein YbaR (Trm112 family)